MQPIINPAATITPIDLFDGSSCVVVDDFLLNADELVGYARALRPAFSSRRINTYPGLEVTLDSDVATPITDFFRDRVRPYFGASRIILASETRFAIVTRKPAELTPGQRLCHIDEPPKDASVVTVAGVMYLFGNPGLGGTAFYAPRDGADIGTLIRILSAGSLFGLMARYEFFRRPAAYLTSSCDFFDFRHVVEARFNRIIFYRGDIYHSGHILRPDLLTDDPATGRLTLNCFYKCRTL